MDIRGIGYVLQDTVANPDLPTPWESKHAIQLSGNHSVWHLPGAPTIGDHGPEFRADPVREPEAEAILECGHRLLFTVAPLTGELLWCSRCESWERCRVPGGYLVKCETCGIEESEFAHNSTLALARARTHGFGKGKQRRAVPHTVLIGRYTETSIDWQKYEKGIS